MIRKSELEGRFPQMCRIMEMHPETSRVTIFVLDARMDAEPGQFVMAWLPDLDEKPFSLVNNNPVTLAVARVGEFTEALHRLSPGDRLWALGPLGRGFTVPAGRLLLVAGGYGAAPLLFLARRAREAGQEVWVALGAAQAGDLLLTRHFEALGCRVAVATEDGSSGRQGLVTGVAETLLEEGGVTALAACGPAALLDAVAEMGRRWDLPTEVSREAYMRCGIGVCGSCAHEGRLVCKDGPVFTVHPTPNEVSPRQTRQLPDLQVTQMTPPPKE